MRGASLCCAVLLAGLPACGVAAQDAPAQPLVAAVQSPVLTLDRDRLFRETLFGKAVDARFKADSDALIAENLRLEKALEAEERDLTDRRSRMSAAEFQVLAKDFDTRTEQIRAAQKAKYGAIAASREAEQQRFLKAAIPVLGDLMRDSGAAAIFDKDMIILSLRGIDITDRAIARIDAVLGNGESSADDPAADDPAATVSPDPQTLPEEPKPQP